jgi:cell division septum initiation protein DivIVA
VPLSRKSSQKPAPPPASGAGSSVAASAGEQVRAIIEAAESSAAQIRTDAEREAKKILAEARRELKRAQDEAAGQTSEQVSKVAQAATSLLERIESIQQEASSVMETLRAGGDRLVADLRLLEESVSALSSTPADEEDVAAAAVVVEEQDEEEEAEPTTLAEAEAEATPEGGDEDLEGARLIALNMALNGNSREDIDRYLEENFDLADRDALLDEVYASVEG